jgi:CHASE2 domain-containing sensor protein
MGMQNQFKQRLQRGMTRWEISLLPGGMAIALVVLLRWLGALQGLEWTVFDRFLRSRPAEGMDRRILIVGINEKDIQQLGTYPVPDRELAIAIRQLQQWKPAVIGLDVFRDQPVPIGATELNQVFQTQRNVIGIEKRLGVSSAVVVSAPIVLPREQIGFVDAALDGDGALRRSLLYTEDGQGQVYPSLSILLAESYLEQQGLKIEQGIHDPDSLRLGGVELPRLQGRTGGYHHLDLEGLVSLINFRSGHRPFRVVSLQDLKSGKVSPEWVRNAVVLVGIMSPAVRDYVNSQAIESENPALVYGVEAQAHAVSQLISAGENGRPFIQVWAWPWEYLWIVAWGGMGIVLGWVVRSPGKWLLGVGVGVGLIAGLGYGLILVAWWIPVVPPLLVFLINGAGLTAFYRYDQGYRSRLQERQSIIDETFNAIHNGPLQTLSMLRRNSKDDRLSPEELLGQLENLDQSIRGIYESMLREGLNLEASVYVSDRLRLNAGEPLHEVLQQVYGDVLGRDLPYFSGIKVKVVNFEPLDERSLSVELKRGLCRFLEEALCNVGKHAIGVTRLEVRCGSIDGQMVIKIVDNGQGVLTEREGMGTQQAQKLAKRLRGRFDRSVRFPFQEAAPTAKGVSCELSWTVRRGWRNG